MPGLEGTTLGRYYLQERLGRGGMSEVYLAYDESMKRQVAIKIVSSIHSDYIERFRREVETLAVLNHSHILPAFDYGEQGPWHYLVMPYLENGTLADRLAEGPLTLEEAGVILEQIASALQLAHDHSVIHRDIKASNILLCEDGSVYLADFGLAKMLEGSGDLTQSGTILGTPEYMAPELSEGPATTSSDIYALGVLLYQMVTGQVPFTGETPISIYWKHIRERPLPPSELRPDIPVSVEAIILRALAKDPLQRFQSAQTLAEAYRQALLAPGDIASHFDEILMPSLNEMPPLSELVPTSKKNLTEAYREHPSFAKRMRARVALRRSRATTAPPLIFPLQQIVEQPVPVSQTPALPVNSLQRPLPSRRRRLYSNPVFIAAMVGIGLLFVITLPIAYILSRGGLPGQSNAATIRQVAQQMQVTSTSPASNTSTVAAPALIDRLSSNTNNRWSENATTCLFTGGNYHAIVRQADALQLCSSNSLSLTNAAIQVSVSLLSGNDAGLLFRANGEQFYDFEITSTGEFFFRRHDSGGGASYTYLIPNTKSAAIAPGTQKNTLLAIANASDFKLYINGTLVGETQDSTYTQGQIGFVVGTLASTSLGEASFADLELFKV